MSPDPSPSHFTTDGQSVSPSWRRTPVGTHDLSPVSSPE